MAKRKAVKAGASTGATAARIARFIEAYISNGENGTQAAIAAGWSARSAHVIASRLLKKDNVQALVQAHRKAAQTKVEHKTERTLQEAMRIAYFDPRKLFNADGTMKKVTEWDDDTAACVIPSKIELVRDGRKVIGQHLELKVWDKNAGLEKLMKFAGMFEKDNKQKPRGADLRVKFVPSPNTAKPAARAK